MTTTRLLRWAPLLLVAVLAAGCSAGQSAGTADKAPEIATLTTPPPGTPTSPGRRTTASDPDAGRPRERIDMTDADRQRLYQPYLVCLKDHGVDVLSDRAKPTEPGVLGDGGRATDPKTKEKAGQACAGKLPLPAWEIDAKNPDALDFGRKVVQCLKDKGVKYVELSTGTDTGIVGPSLGGPQNDAESIRKGMDLTPECQREVAGK